MIDYLINNDKEVFDVESENILKATHAFEYIQCRIEPESNVQAMQQSSLGR